MSYKTHSLSQRPCGQEGCKHAASEHEYGNPAVPGVSGRCTFPGCKCGHFAEPNGVIHQYDKHGRCPCGAVARF